MPRPARPYVTSLDQVHITRDGETAIIEYRDGSAATTHFGIGPALAGMTDRQVLDRFNEMLRVRDRRAAEHEYVAIEVPPGSPQVSYFAAGDQLTPRGGVLRCLIEDGGPDGETQIEIDDRTLSLEEFGRLLSTYTGWGMRICFVPDDELERPAKIRIAEPED